MKWFLYYKDLRHEKVKNTNKYRKVNDSDNNVDDIANNNNLEEGWISFNQQSSINERFLLNVVSCQCAFGLHRYAL